VPEESADLVVPAGPANLRHWRPEDAPGLASQANDRRIWLGLRDAFPSPYLEEDGRRFLAMEAAMSPRTYFAIDVDGTIAGGIGYTLKDDVERIGAEVGYWLGVRYWGRGIATAALAALTRHAFRVHPELRRLWAVPLASNPASARVLEKAGYRREGTMRQSAIKNGQVHDQWLYAIVRDDLSANESDAAH
jgi:[ribosomal protein S5]-alanine N-acetyltransferase